MKRSEPLTRFSGSLAIFLAAALSGCHAASPSHPPLVAQGAVCAVYFSPHGGCTDVIVEALRGAKQTVRVQAYSFTSQPIAQALVEARNRGVHVDVIVDKSQLTERHALAGWLAQHGVPVSVDRAHAIAHNKVMIIDGRAVFTGSFNFTSGAEERNAENLLLVRDEAVATKYEDNWRVHRAHSSPYRATTP